MTKMLYPARSILTLVGVVAFVVLAIGSNQQEDKSYTSLPDPKNAGKESAISWVTQNSALLTSKFREVEEARLDALTEVYRLENLKRQFPEQRSKISNTESRWQQVVIDLESSIEEVNQMIANAYVDSQVGEGVGSDLLQDIYEEWSPRADRALQEYERQRERSAIEAGA